MLSSNTSFCFKKIYNVSKNLKRQVMYLDIAEILNKEYEKWQNEKLINLSNEMYKIVIDEYADVFEKISDYEKCRVTKENSEQMLKSLKENYEKAKSMVK